MTFQRIGARLLHAVVIVFLAFPAAAQQRAIDSCGILDRPGTTYILQKDVSSPGSCFLVKAERITLDLNGHAITYGTASTWEPGQETAQHVHGILGQACWDKGGHAVPERPPSMRSGSAGGGESAPAPPGA